MSENKPRRHPFVTECLLAGSKVLSVWPSDGEDIEKFKASILKISNDPRVQKVEQVPEQHDGNLYIFILGDQDVDT